MIYTYWIYIPELLCRFRVMGRTQSLMSHNSGDEWVIYRLFVTQEESVLLTTVTRWGGLG